MVTDYIKQLLHASSVALYGNLAVSTGDVTFSKVQDNGGKPRVSKIKTRNSEQKESEGAVNEKEETATGPVTFRDVTVSKAYDTPKMKTKEINYSQERIDSSLCGDVGIKLKDKRKAKKANALLIHRDNVTPGSMKKGSLVEGFSLFQDTQLKKKSGEFTVSKVTDKPKKKVYEGASCIQESLASSVLSLDGDAGFNIKEKKKVKKDEDGTGHVTQSNTNNSNILMEANTSDTKLQESMGEDVALPVSKKGKKRCKENEAPNTSTVVVYGTEAVKYTDAIVTKVRKKSKKKDAANNSILELIAASMVALYGDFGNKVEKSKKVQDILGVEDASLDVSKINTVPIRVQHDEAVSDSLSNKKRAKKNKVKQKKENVSESLNHIIHDCSQDPISSNKKKKKSKHKNNTNRTVSKDDRGFISNEIFITEASVKEETILPDSIDSANDLDYDQLVEGDPLDLNSSYDSLMLEGVTDGNKENHHSKPNSRAYSGNSSPLLNQLFSEGGSRSDISCSAHPSAGLKTRSPVLKTLKSVSLDDKVRSLISRSNFPLSRSSSPVSEKSSPLSKSRAPQCRSTNSVSISSSPLSRSQSPQSRIQSPVSRSRSPLSRSRSPLSRSQSPVSRSQSPLSRGRSPQSGSSSPVSRSQSPQSGSSSPVSRSHSPLSSCSSQSISRSSVSRSFSPISRSHSSLSRSCSPQSRSSSPVSRSHSRLSSCSSRSVSRSCSPISRSLSPLKRSCNSVCRGDISLGLNGSSLSRSGTPFSGSGSPVPSSKSPTPLSRATSPISRSISTDSNVRSPISKRERRKSLSNLPPYLACDPESANCGLANSVTKVVLSKKKSSASRSSSPLSNPRESEHNQSSPVSISRSPSSLLNISCNICPEDRINCNFLSGENGSDCIRPIGIDIGIDPDPLVIGTQSQSGSIKPHSNNESQHSSLNFLTEELSSSGRSATEPVTRTASPQTSLANQHLINPSKAPSLPSISSGAEIKRRRRSNILRYDLFCKSVLDTPEKTDFGEKRLPSKWKTGQNIDNSSTFSVKRKLSMGSNNPNNGESPAKMPCSDESDNGESHSIVAGVDKPGRATTSEQRRKKKRLLSMKTSVWMSDCDEAQVPTSPPTFDDAYKDASKSKTNVSNSVKNIRKKNHKFKLSTPSSSKNQTLVGDIYTGVMFGLESEMTKVCKYILKRDVPVGLLNSLYTKACRPKPEDRATLLKYCPNLKIGKFLDHEDSLIMKGYQQLVDRDLVTDKEKLMIEYANILNETARARNILGLFVGQGILENRLAYDICDRLFLLLSGDPYFSQPYRKCEIRRSGKMAPYQKPQDKRNSPRVKWKCDEDKQLLQHIMDATNSKAVEDMIVTKTGWKEISEKIGRPVKLVRLHWLRILKPMLVLADQDVPDDIDFKMKLFEAILKMNVKCRKEIDWIALEKKFLPRPSQALQNAYNGTIYRVDLPSHNEILQYCVKNLRMRKVDEDRRRRCNVVTEKEKHVKQVQDHYLSLIEN